ncbi:hypothetical protein Csa_023951, partial [Cucumis sativus]
EDASDYEWELLEELDDEFDEEDDMDVEEDGESLIVNLRLSTHAWKILMQNLRVHVSKWP